MASQQDLQELLRLLTVTRKVPMLQAMGQVKGLQGRDLRSIKQIAEAPFEKVEAALDDGKAARALQSACKAVLKRGLVGGNKLKRAAVGDPGASDNAPKRIKGSDPVMMTPQQLEKSLHLPLSMDEERIAQTVLETNRAPLLLAFTVELLRYTMKEQPLSSRLSLAQAVVSANAQFKASAISVAAGRTADDEGWGEGQPKIRIMLREVTVLKRSGLEWPGDEMEGETKNEREATGAAANTEHETWAGALCPKPTSEPPPFGGWAASQPVSLKSSTFVARAMHMTDPTQKHGLMRSLLNNNPTLKTATHNAWAYRVRATPGESASDRICEASDDDGETGCGNLMLRTMRESGAADILVVLTRWFGGTLLGTDRWRLMRSCVTSALAEKMRKTGVGAALGGEAVWGLDLTAMRSKSNSGGGQVSSNKHHHPATGVVGMPIHKPEAARNYILKSFATAAQDESADKSTPRKSGMKKLEEEREENLGLVLGGLRIVFDSWAGHLTAAELDGRAWNWYASVRPDVERGPSGWGAKGRLKLQSILNLRRQPQSSLL